MSRQQVWLLLFISLIFYTPKVLCFIITDQNTEITFEQFAKEVTTEITNLKAENHQLRTEVDSLKAKAAKDVVVAFHAEISGVTNIPTHSTARFNKVDVNIGNGYNNGSGLFRAPVGGVYLFFLQVYSKPGQIVSLYLMKQGTVVNEAVAGLDGYQSNTVAEMIHLNKGEDVWAQHFVGDTSLEGHYHVHFSGFLLKADKTVVYMLLYAVYNINMMFVYQLIIDIDR
ncbi:complement C1q tumor necrosis factor-related protein 3-like [Gigantopelta aegis]|uniref:complement C1q tumor necrosis factor-related protein 3-like n=1 Tax=Gigantopelta aegis TaxID=1735272 RepID=UPI001B88CDCE|nr:complement C1q tumor necrosis factor-related protein 3-like [Gigantopelta aegis]